MAGKWEVGRQALSTDRTISQKLLGDLTVALEKGKAGLNCEFREHLGRPISEHVADYVSHLTEKGVSEKCLSERSRCFQTVIDECGIKTLADLTVDQVDRFLRERKGTARTKDIYRAAALGFCNWLVRMTG